MLVKIKKRIKDVVTFFLLVKVYYFLFIKGWFFYKKKCLLITHVMNLSGAPLMLLEAAKVYKNNGYKVVVMSNTSGCLKKEFHKFDISVLTILDGLNAIIFRRLLRSNFDFVLVNTITLYNYINILNDTNIPTIWWLHESDFYVSKYYNKIPTQLNSNISVLTVSDLVLESLKKFNINYSTDMMYYGIPDLYKKNQKKSKKDNFFNILVIGGICKRKNQMMAIDAYNKLPNNVRKTVKIYFVGEPLKEENEYYLNFKKQIEEQENLIYIKSVERDSITDLYNYMDAVLCCSMDDPLPVVVTEALMLKIPVIVSSKTGQFPLINHGINGYKFNYDNLDELVGLLNDLCTNNKYNKEIIRNGRKLYNNNFTLDLFEKKLIFYTKNIIGK